MAMTKAQRRIEKMASLAAEQAEYEKRVKIATKRAAFARCEAVEQLYEMFDIEEEPGTQRVTKRDGVERAIEVACDRDESKRAARLVAAVEALVIEQQRAAGDREALPASPPARTGEESGQTELSSFG